jgi:hypothetical protein
MRVLELPNATCLGLESTAAKHGVGLARACRNGKRKQCSERRKKVKPEGTPLQRRWQSSVRAAAEVHWPLGPAKAAGQSTACCKTRP